MSLVPVFDIGVWNGWLFVIFVFLTYPLYILVGKISSRDISHISKEPPGTKKWKSTLANTLSWLAMLYVIFLPLKLGTTWFTIGLPVFLVGLAVFVTSIASFTTALLNGRPATDGIYRYSRHPMYIGMSLIFIGTGIATASWLFLLLSLVLLILLSSEVVFEERFCGEHFGDTYREYLSRTPRWLGLPKSVSKG